MHLVTLSLTISVWWLLVFGSFYRCASATWLDQCANFSIVDCATLSAPLTSVTISSQNVTIANCTLSGCPRILVTNGANVNILNVQFRNVTSNNTNMEGGVLSVTEQATVILVNCTFRDVHTQAYGGAVYVLSARAEFHGCTFQRCTGSSGGAIYGTVYANIRCENCSFSDNKATTLHGGSVYVWKMSTLECIECNFHRSTAMMYGGAMHVDLNCTINWNGGSCINCSALTWGGCGIFNEGVLATVQNVEISGLRADQGSIFFLQNVRMKLRNIVGSNCSSTTQAGCFYIYTDTYLRIYDSTFDGCTAGSLGGFAWIQTLGYAEVHNTTVTRPTARRGSVFYLYDRAIAHIYNSYLEGGASLAGGGIASVEGPNTTFTCHNSTLRGGSAIDHYAGCILAGEGLSVTVEINGCIIENCVSKGNGAAIWGGQGIQLYLRDTILRNNTAYGLGGGLYLTAGTAHFGPGTVLLNNTATVCGGGLAVEGDTSELYLAPENVSIFDNTAPKGELGCVTSSTNQSSIIYRSTDQWIDPNTDSSQFTGKIWVDNAAVGLNMLRDGLPNKIPGSSFWGKAALIALVGGNPNLAFTVNVRQSLPTFCVYAKDVFGNICDIDKTLPIVVQLGGITSVSGGGNMTIGGESSKAILDKESQQVCFPEILFRGKPGDYAIQVSAVPGTISLRPGGVWPVLDVNVSDCTSNELFLVSSSIPDGQCYQKKAIGEVTRSSIAVIGGICAALSSFIAIGLFKLRAVKVVKANSVTFLMLACLGSALSLSSLVVSVGDQPVAACVVAPWFDHLGFATVFGAIVLKTFRIYRIFDNRNLDQKLGHKLRDARLLIHLGGGVGLMVAFLIVWTAVKPAYPDVKLDNSFAVVDRCQQSEFSYVVTVVRLLVQIVAVWLAFSIRNVHADFNESRFILFATYNWAIFGGIIELISASFIDDPEVAHIFHGVSVCIPNVVTAALLGGVKIVICWIDRAQANGEQTGNGEKEGKLILFGILRRGATLDSSTLGGKA